MTDARPLGLILLGYGRMNRAVAALAQGRGHRIAAIVSPHAPEASHRGLEALNSIAADAAIEFTTADAAEPIVRGLLERGIPTVSGSTGWNAGVERMRTLAAQRAVGFLWAPNFSLGMAVLADLTTRAAIALGGLGGWSPYVVEEHHQAKRDAPSGSAQMLAQRVVDAMPGKSRFGVAPHDAPLPADLVSVAWVRAGAIPGNHRVGFDAAGETLEITHRVRDRATFAHGAVRAAEWVAPQRGPLTLQQFVTSVWDLSEESD